MVAPSNASHLHGGGDRAGARSALRRRYGGSRPPGHAGGVKPGAFLADGCPIDIRPPVTQPALFEIPRLRRLARHAGPHLVESTLVPLVLFYASLWVIGVWAALAAALGWSYACIGRRLLAGRRVPGMLALGSAALTARTVISVASGSVFVYFLQPTLGTVVVAGTFLASVPAGRPLAAKLAADFCPLPEAFSAHPQVRQYFQRVSLLWAFVYFANAGATLWLLLSQSIAVFVVARTLLSGTVTVTTILVSATWFRRSMRRHGLLVPQPSVDVAPAAVVG